MNKNPLSFNQNIHFAYERAEKFGLIFFAWPKWFCYQVKETRNTFPLFLYSKNKKSLLKVFSELLHLTIKWRCIPFHYFRYKLYSNNYSTKNVLNFMPETVMYYKILPEINNNIRLLDDKNIFEEICKGNNLPIPPTLLKIKKGTIFDRNSNIVDSDDKLNKTLFRMKSNKIFMKPSDASSGGNEIILFRHDNTTNSYKNNKKDVLDYKLLQKLSYRDWIVQEAVKQVEELNRINPSSINTFRVLTYFSPRIGAKVLCCTLRCGANESIVDNVHRGGLHLNIGLRDGSMADVAYDGKKNFYLEHPDSKYVFKGKKITKIKEIINLSVRSANLFPDIVCIGWDIALTPKGPIVIEGNSSPALEMQVTMNGLAKILLSSYNKQEKLNFLS